ncbi:MAG: radical SAM protein [Syntrophomonadaceae bacterium]|jgi:radical SAM protein with 4Fe4S-binding SPASM domain
MIGITKLLCNTATVSEVIKYSGQEGKIPPNLLQFSEINRPLVVWNTTNRCNLKCRHCYINAEDRSYDGELTTDEAKIFIQDLAAMKVPVLLFSGGEPLVRKDIFELGKMAADLGLRPVLSSNGTLIDEDKALKIKEAGFQYVGISIDGAKKTHDAFRGFDGAFDAALQGIRNCLNIGLKTGIRFTVNRFNQGDLPEIIDIVEQNQIPRFCMYHLVYSGRGQELIDMDTSLKEKRAIIEFLGKKAVDLKEKGVEVEILTTDNHADGLLLLNYMREKEPSRAEEIIKLLEMHGGCSAGTKFANVDPKGNVHPCQFWQDYTVGNIRETPFSQIWNSQDALMVKLREKHKHIKGKCANCAYNFLCCGCRIRARAVNGDIWAEDPACYLSLEEISRKTD